MSDGWTAFCIIYAVISFIDAIFVMVDLAEGDYGDVNHRSALWLLMILVGLPFLAVAYPVKLLAKATLRLNDVEIWKERRYRQDSDTSRRGR